MTNKRNRTQLFDTTSTPGPTLLHRVTRRVMGRAELEALQFPGLYTIEHVYTPAQAAARHDGIDDSTECECLCWHVSWSNTQILAAVASNAVTGVARVQQNGVWSNAVTFTVPSSGSAVTLVPNLLNLDIGQNHAIQALDSTGQPVTGLNWTSSNSDVVSVSTNDPPTLTAQAQGNATIQAGGASTVVTVSPPKTVPPSGTVLWSDPVDAGVISLVPAVPSVSGVADMFALDGNCNVWAVTSDGTEPWMSNIGQLPQYTGNVGHCSEFIPDFQGGLVAMSESTVTTTTGFVYFQYHLQKFDGITGQAYPAYNEGMWWQNLNVPLSESNFFWPPSVETFPPTVVHTNGTIFTVVAEGDVPEGVSPGLPLGFGAPGVAVINPLTGRSQPVTFGGNEFPIGSYASFQFGGFGNWIIGGDGYAYLPYSYEGYTWPPVCIPNASGSGCNLFPPCTVSNGTVYSSTLMGTVYLSLLRMDTTGNASSIPLGNWNVTGNCSSNTYASPTNVTLITNANQGVLLTWQLKTSSSSLAGWGTTSTTNYIATTSGTSVVSQGTTVPALTPVLQAQDGTFFGTDSNRNMVKFDQSGKVTWSVPGDTPQIATPDGGVIGVTNTTYDSNLNATGQLSILPIQSWTGLGYTFPLQQVAFVTTAVATPPFWSFSNFNLSPNPLVTLSGANQSANGTSPLCQDDRDPLIKEYGSVGVLDSYYASLPPYGPPPKKAGPQFTPNCFELAGSGPDAPHSANFNFQQISTNHPWALIKYPLVAPATVGYGLDQWLQIYQQRYGSLYGSSRTITSGYRDPISNLAAKGATSSRHMLGDAIDFQSATHSLNELNAMNDAANRAQADFVEDPAIMTTYCANPKPPTGLPYPCAHADWRRHDRGKYVH